MSEGAQPPSASGGQEQWSPSAAAAHEQMAQAAAMAAGQGFDPYMFYEQFVGASGVQWSPTTYGLYSSIDQEQAGVSASSRSRAARQPQDMVAWVPNRKYFKVTKGGRVVQIFKPENPDDPEQVEIQRALALEFATSLFNEGRPRKRKAQQQQQADGPDLGATEQSDRATSRQAPEPRLPGHAGDLAQAAAETGTFFAIRFWLHVVAYTYGDCQTCSRFRLGKSKRHPKHPPCKSCAPLKACVCSRTSENI